MTHTTLGLLLITPLLWLWAVAKAYAAVKFRHDARAIAIALVLSTSFVAGVWGIGILTGVVR